MLVILWRLTKGYRLHPWDSPFLKWRIETWSGTQAATVTPGIFFRFVWQHLHDMLRYLRWADENSRGCSGSW